MTNKDLFQAMDFLGDEIARKRGEVMNGAPEHRYYALQHVDRCMNELGILKAMLEAKAQVEMAFRIQAH